MINFEKQNDLEWAGQTKDLNENRNYIYIRLLGFEQKPIQEEISIRNDKLTYRVKFEISQKTCTTEFVFDKKTSYYTPSLESLKDETHLFCYQAEQVMNVELTLFTKESSHKSKQIQSGFSRVVITPLIALPYTRHSIDIPIIQTDSYRKLQENVIGVLKIELFYLFNFEAELVLYPFAGNFQRNLLLGQMRLCCIFQINEQREKSLIDEEGGIHPKWHEFAKSIEGNTKNNTNLSNQFRGLQSNTMRFRMNSVGHTLKIDVVNFPELDSDAQIVGSAEIYIASRDYLRLSYQNIDEKKKRKIIKLMYIDPVTKLSKDAGQIEIGVSFNFDALKIRKQVDSDEDDLI